MTIDLQIEASITLTSGIERLSLTNAAAYLLTTAADVWTVQEIDPEQAWFWSKTWQGREAEADSEIREGRYEEFDDLDAFLSSL